MRYSQSGFVIVTIIHRKNDNVNSKNRKKTYYPNRHKSVRFMFCSSTNGSIIDYPGKNPNFNETLFSKFKIFRYNALSMASSVSSSEDCRVIIPSCSDFKKFSNSIYLHGVFFFYLFDICFLKKWFLKENSIYLHGVLHITLF